MFTAHFTPRRALVLLLNMKSWIIPPRFVPELSTLLVVVCALTLSSVTPAAAQVVNLDPRNDFASSEALDINDAGQIVGYGDDAASTQAVLWTVSGSGVQCKRLASGSIAYGINKHGVIVGSGSDIGTAVYWINADALATILPASSPEDEVYAYAINNDGVIVGKSIDAAGDMHPVAWRVCADGTVDGPIDLGGLGLASDINNVVDGLADVVGDTLVAFQNRIVWRATRWTLLIPPGRGLTVVMAEDLGVLPGGQSSRACGVTDAGSICGSSSGPDAPMAAFVIRGNGPMTALPKVRGEVSSEAFALNDTYVVGYSSTNYVTNKATYWDARRATQLSAKKWVLNVVRAINTSGAMVGSGQYSGDVNVRAFLRQ